MFQRETYATDCFSRAFVSHAWNGAHRAGPGLASHLEARLVVSQRNPLIFTVAVHRGHASRSVNVRQPWTPSIHFISAPPTATRSPAKLDRDKTLVDAIEIFNVSRRVADRAVTSAHASGGAKRCVLNHGNVHRNFENIRSPRLHVLTISQMS